MIGRILFHYVGWEMKVEKDKRIAVDTTKTFRGIRNIRYMQERMKEGKSSRTKIKRFITFCHDTW